MKTFKTVAGYVLTAFVLWALVMLALGAGQARTAQAQQHPAAMTLSAAVVHVAPSGHVSLPSWVHWKHASAKAAREVCGHGPAVIVWGGSGDTSVIVCGNGKAGVS